MYQASAPPPHAPQPYAQPSYPPPPYAQLPYQPQPYPQPPYATPQHRGPPGRIQRGEWSSGLCDCFKDCHNCFITHWCPCITFGRIAEIVDKGSPSCETSGAMYCLIASVTCHAWIYSCFYRSKLRAQYGLPESPCPDCLVHCCCEWCALCQEYRELKSRGFNMSIGWEENQEKKRLEMAMAPTPQGGMTR